MKTLLLLALIATFTYRVVETRAFLPRLDRAALTVRL